jgi:hypothetical protein
VQDEISEKALNLAVRISKLTAGEIRKALEKLLADLKSGNYPGKKIADTLDPNKTPKPKHGKMTHRQLKKRSDGLSVVELTDPNLRLLQREMRKKDIDFAVEKDGKGKYILYFKGKDVDDFSVAFKKYTQKTVALANRKPPIKKLLAAAKVAAQALNAKRDKVKTKTRGARDILLLFTKKKEERRERERGK